nr:uncharacterized protein LOC107430264 isoform X3 [Ziziphus jujuba var. spinosa]
MDYDDNDFQSQNLHLAGEGSTKYPPVLRPYALPKFDFDDSLQGHLRFDSLVETEVFLGIESNEDNRWIEDFSRGSSGIQFSSSAAESCSISRCNNVWSEATSSESVEMLLKSVGQEEIIPAQTIIEESDACDLPGCLTKEMEPSLKHDDNILSKTKDVPGVQSLLPLVEIPGNFSGLKGDVGVEQPCVKDGSQTQEDQLFVDGSSNNLDPNAVSEKCGVTDGNAFAGSRDDAQNREADTSNDKDMDAKAQEDSFAQGTPVDNSLTSVQNIITSKSELSSSDVQHQINVSNENLGGHVLSEKVQMDSQNMDGNIVDNTTCNYEKLLCSTSKVETVAEVNAVKDSIISGGEFSSNILKGDSYQRVVDACNEGECSGVAVETSKCEDRVLCKDMDVGGEQDKVNKHQLSAVSVIGDAQLEGHAVEANFASGVVASSLESKLDSIVEITYGESRSKEDAVKSDQHLDIVMSEEPLASIEDNNVSKDEGNESRNSHMGDISDVTIKSSSAELGNETLVTGVSKGVKNSFEVPKENLSADDHVSPAILAESIQIHEQNKAYSDSDVHRCNQDAMVNKKESTELPIDSRNIDGESVESSDKGFGSSSFEASKGDKLIVSELQHATAIGSGSDVNLENSVPASSDTNDPVPLSTENDVKMDVDHEEIQATPLSVVGFADMDKKEEAASNISKETSLSSPVSSSQVEAGLGTVSGAKEGLPCDTGGQLSYEAVGQSCTEPGSEPQAPAASEVGKDHTKEVNVSLVAFESTEKEAAVAEAPEGHNGATKDKYLGRDTADSSEPATTNDKMLTQPGVRLKEMCSTAQIAQEGSEATLVSKDKSSGQTIEPSPIRDASGNHASSVASDPLLKSRTKFVSQDNGGSSADQNKPIYGSPKLAPRKYGKGIVKGSTKQKSTKQNSPVTLVVDQDDGNASNSHDPKGSDTSKERISGNFDVSALAELSKEDAGKNSQSVTPKTAAEPSSNPVLGQSDAKIAQDVAQASVRVSDAEIVRGRTKGTPERKTRRSSAKTTGKDSTKKGTLVKDTTPSRPSDKEKMSNVSLSQSGMFQLMQSNEMPHYGHVESTNTKSYFLLSAATSNLPDLNTSASPSVVFQQPFTDMQQVQLRAQIFVYGALIQGIAPEEAYMASAFGGPDGGRSLWENAWHACIARVHGQNANPINQETPLHARTGARAPDHVVKQSALQSKGTSPVGRASTKGTPTIVNPMIPLSSPLWSISTPVGDTLQSTVVQRGSVVDYQQALTPMHPFQTPPMRNLIGHNSSWMPLPTFRGPWVASPQPSLPEASSRFSTFPSTEAVQLTPIKETSIPHSSGTKHISSGPVVQSVGPASVFSGPSPLLDPKKVATSVGQHSADPKPRKRKKNLVPEEPSQINLQSQSQPEPVLASVDTNSLSTSVTITAPKTFVPKPTSDKVIPSVAPTSSEHFQKVDQNAVQTATLSEETLGKIKEARKQAEDAAARASTAVSHSQDLWSQLDKQKNSGLVSDVEAKLASAAVAVAAAAAVAKAAAAAANVASNAALQAKLMADEALILNGSVGSIQSTRISFSGENVLGKATPASILRGEDGANSSSSVIVAAREAAKRRVEAASAAAKRAENMDAIVKAAELAAEAVSQAGKIVAMGDPLPLSELVQFGPEGYWKIAQVSSEQGGKSIGVVREQSIAATYEEFANTSKHPKDGQSGKKGTQLTANEKSPIVKEVSKELTDDHLRLVDGVSGSVASSKRESRGQKGRKVSDLTPNTNVILESETGEKSSAVNAENEFGKAAEISEVNIIKEGSQVEVFKDGNGFKAAWFTATVLSVEDGKANVSYADIQSDEGLGQLKEWVPLKGEGDKAPKIRNARPLTAMRYEGTRKRRRAAIGDYTWSVGDRVDAWIADSWWEGVVTEKNKKDETTLTVHFPAQGETSVVKAWHLRPSLIWKDGEWVEFSNLRNDSSSLEGDIPQEKRIKLGSPAVEVKGKDKMLKSIDVADSGKLEESRLLDLSGNDKVFNIGKSTRNENKPDSTRTIRTGLRKEGSRVVIGVPKPGKKRKFMEVSKHYVADQGNKVNEVNDSAKLAKYLMPQVSGSRGLKSTKNDTKEKRVAESKLRSLKSGKQLSVSSRTVPQKNNLSGAVTAHGDDTVTDHTSKIKDSLSHDENSSGKHNQMETGSFSSIEEAAEGPIVFSSLAPTSDVPPSKKNSTSNTKSERANRGKLAPASGKLDKIEEDRVFNGDSGKSNSELVEPRRSNRRIQPTSRLLEGLQSSLIISKIPSVSHDKGHRSQNRSTPRGGNNHG